MKRSLTFILIAVVSVLVVACHKNSSGPSAGYGPNSLFPLKAGDTWYYQDSSFSDTALKVAYPDTMFVTKNTYTDPNSGTIFLEVNNPNGWFIGSYIAVDPSNTAVYEADSLGGLSPYTFFQTVSQDGPIGTGNDYTNPACPLSSVQYGYANPVSEYGYQCYKNVEVTTDCHQTVLEEVVSYLSPGIGVVRMEDYQTDTVGGANIYHESYSQTLTAKSLH